MIDGFLVDALASVNDPGSSSYRKAPCSLEASENVDILHIGAGHLVPENAGSPIIASVAVVAKKLLPDLNMFFSFSFSKPFWLEYLFDEGRERLVLGFGNYFELPLEHSLLAKLLTIYRTKSDSYTSNRLIGSSSAQGAK